eukprot:COSAG04_NODE_13725_length_594_cov_0.963636_1_plen_101_part_01
MMGRALPVLALGLVLDIKPLPAAQVPAPGTVLAAFALLGEHGLVVSSDAPEPTSAPADVADEETPFDTPADLADDETTRRRTQFNFGGNFNIPDINLDINI